MSDDDGVFLAAQQSSRAFLVALAASTLLVTGCAAAEPTPIQPIDETTNSVTSERALGGTDCLVGDWVMAPEQLERYYDSVGASSGGTDFRIEGGAGVIFTDSTFVYTPEFRVLVDGDVAEGTGSSISGSMRGSYTAEDSVITTTQESNDTVLTVTFGGMTIDASQMLDDLLGTSPIDSAPYECSAEGPLIFFEASDERVPVQLTAR